MQGAMKIKESWIVKAKW